MNWVDGVIIAILIVSTVRGYSEGFVLSLMNIVGLVTAIIAARLYFVDLAGYLRDSTVLYERIYIAVLKGLEGSSPMLRDTGSGGWELPVELGELFPFINAAPVTGDAVMAGIAQAISGIIISLLSIILIFLAVRLAFILIIAFLNSITALPVLKQFNKLGGIMVGFLKGVLGLMLTFALIIPVTAVFPAQWLLKGIEGSATAVLFYRYNFIVPWAMEIVSRIIYI
ncbi:MAG: CvpA family protein [Bacillota bacterium]|nr:CvpA family protein [Bacillota bacterium]MDD3298014.1 CvpA family protein [Bacillota bacterium]MDD3850045.1 CvpA family protein [Bacillota bacterium]MDD4706718.1 CvpA family protein [Bacillota bacterium]